MRHSCTSIYFLSIALFFFIASPLVHAIPIAPSLCGNGDTDGDEQCDDGNNRAGDGCSPSCQFEDPCGCMEGSQFLCGFAYESGENIITLCCPTRVHPITQFLVCACHNDDLWPTPLATIDPDTCEVHDINECAMHHPVCPSNAICLNLDGRNVSAAQYEAAGSDNPSLGLGYDCICPSEFHKDVFMQCSPDRFLSSILLLSSNASDTEQFYFSPESIVEASVAYLQGHGLWNESHLVKLAEAAYLSGLSSLSLTSPLTRRRLLQTDPPGGEVVAISFETNTWESLQTITEQINEEQLAMFLQNYTQGLNLISVLQSATAVVDENPASYTAEVASAPGFGVEGFTFVTPPSTALNSQRDFWRINSHYFAPAGVHAALFLSKHGNSTNIMQTECIDSPDVCCLPRFADSHYVSASLTALIDTHLRPWCVEIDGVLVPNATVQDRSSEAIMQSLSLAASGESWVLDVLQQQDPMFNGSSVTIASGVDAFPGSLVIDLTQQSITSLLAAADTGTITTNGNVTSYTFSIGVLFFRPVTSSPRLFTTVAETKLQIQVSDTVAAVVVTEQAYSFLEGTDVVAFEVEYRPSAAELLLLQFVRVMFVVPAGFHLADAPGTSVQWAFGSSPTDILSQSNLLWTDACFSALDPISRTGAGLWDFNNGTRVDLTLAAERACANQGVTASFCALTNETVISPDVASVYHIDVPIGESVVPAYHPTNTSYLFLRMAVQASRPAAPALVLSGIQESTAMSLLSMQVVLDQSRLIGMCEDPVTSVVKDTDFVRTSLTIGVEFSTVDPQVQFDDVTGVPTYDSVSVLDTSQVYQAVSVVDSLLTLSLGGSHAFFSVYEHLSYLVRLDTVVLIHIRNDDKYAAMQTMIQNGTAFQESVNARGFKQVDLAFEFAEVCVGTTLAQATAETSKAASDCVIATAMSDAEILHESAIHEVSENTNNDLFWLLFVFGDTPYMRNMALEFASRTRERFSLQYRYRRAWWISPAYAWPGSQISEVSDRTLVLTSYTVVH